MDVTTFITTVFCLIDDRLADGGLHTRGPRPVLADSEVLTIEPVGEFLGLDTDAGLWRYFRVHFADWFPGLARVHRTTFARQAANLWAVKQQLWQYLSSRVEHDEQVSVIDSVAVARSDRGGRVDWPWPQT